jgi:hypothetical protein
MMRNSWLTQLCSASAAYVAWPVPKFLDSKAR